MLPPDELSPIPTGEQGHTTEEPKTHQLRADEAAALEQHEAVIERGITTFIEVGTALRHIRDQRLYRAMHDTFEAYCLERWKLSKTHVNRQIKAADVADDLAPIGVKATHEAQLRPLASLSPDVRRTVWKQAVEQSGGQQPTASQVEVSKQFVCGVIADQARTCRGRKMKAVRRLPPLSPDELIEKHRGQLIDHERKARMWRFVNAIQNLIKPAPNIAELVADILAMNRPDLDCASMAEDARNNLTLLLEQLQKVSLIPASNIDASQSEAQWI